MIEVEFIGYDGTHPGSFIYGLPQGHESYLLVLTSTAAEFLQGDEFRRMPAGCAILYTPGSQVLYRACEETYSNDWIRFRCDESFVDQLPLKNVPFQVNDSAYCHDLFKLMTWESTLNPKPGSEILSHLLHALLLKLGESCSSPEVTPHSQGILDLRKRIYNNPELPWSVDSMAAELHLSSGYLQSLYKNMFGSSCMEDVILQRLKHSKDQLVSTSKSILEISEDCGYNNVEHFCRQFKKFTGVSPSRYRKENANKSHTPVTARESHLTLGGNADELELILPFYSPWSRE